MPLLEQVLEHNPDTVKIVLKNLPLKFHKLADPAARAALAAAEQGKFWEYHDELFSGGKLNAAIFDKIAVKLGLDMAKFKQDMNSPKIKNKLATDMRDASQAGVTGTPTVFINGRRMKNRSLEEFQRIINEELKKKGIQAK